MKNENTSLNGIHKENVAILIWGLSNGGAERAAGLLSIFLSKYYNIYFFLRDINSIVYEYSGTIVDVEPGENASEHCEENVAKAKEKYHIKYSISFLDDMNYINIRTKRKDYVIVSARCTLSYFEKPKYVSMYAMRRYFNKADAVVAVSNGVKYEMIEKFSVNPDKIYTIYNFIQQDVVLQKAQAGKTEPSKDNRKLIVNLGRLVQQKNQLRLIRQFYALKLKRNDVRLLIIGSGEEESSLHTEIERLHLNDDVTIMSYCKNPFRYLLEADLYVMTSHYEGLPNALLEAMCLQIPIVAVDCVGGPRELLAGRSDYENKVYGMELCERGILVEDTQSDDDAKTSFFCDAMQYMLDHGDYAKEVRDNEQEYMKNYSNEKIIKQWEAVLREVSKLLPNPYEDKVSSEKEVFIYGAGKLGKKTLLACKKMEIKVSGFIVSNLEGNPDTIGEVPVIEFSKFHKKPNDIQILLAVGGEYGDDVVRMLLDRGYTNINLCNL